MQFLETGFARSPPKRGATYRACLRSGQQGRFRPSYAADQTGRFWPLSICVCVWKEFADAHPDAKDIVAKSCVLPPSPSTLEGEVASAQPVEIDLRRFARQFFDEWGVPQHPSVLMKALMDRSPKLARRDQEPDRVKRRVRQQQRRITIQQQAGQQQ